MTSKYLLKYPTDVSDAPVISKTVLKTGVMLNILRANVDYGEATLIVDILGDKKEQKKVVDYLRKEGVDVSKLEKNITNNVEKCVDCGACIALCPTQAISFKDDYSIKVNSDKCIRCGVCVEACPLRALEIVRA